MRPVILGNACCVVSLKSSYREREQKRRRAALCMTLLRLNVSSLFEMRNKKNYLKEGWTCSEEPSKPQQPLQEEHEVEEVRVYANTVAQPQISLLKQLPAKVKPFGDLITFCSLTWQKKTYGLWQMWYQVLGSYSGFRLLIAFFQMPNCDWFMDWEHYIMYTVCNELSLFMPKGKKSIRDIAYVYAIVFLHVNSNQSAACYAN